MRRMSFSMTLDAILKRTKTVTRRKGWKFLKPGDRLKAVEQSLGFAAGEKAPPPICIIEVVDVRREPLNRMTEDREYGWNEIIAEGLSLKMGPVGFVERFAKNSRIEPSDDITRIEFRYVEE